MKNEKYTSKNMNILFWVTQVLLAVILIMGAIMKFLPIEKIAPMMPWTGQIPALFVRLLGIIDLLGAVGLILPSLLKIKPQLTFWTSLCIIALMLCAIVFHISRGEATSIGINIFSMIIAAFIAWGRYEKRGMCKERREM